jgi:hypothetical protein
MVSILSETIAPVLGAAWLAGGAIMLFLFAKQKWHREMAVAAVAMIIFGAIILASGSVETRLFSLAAGMLVGTGLSFYGFRS